MAGKVKKGGRDKKRNVREPKTDGREPKTDGREPKTDVREPKTDVREPKTDGREAKTDGRKPKTDGLVKVTFLGSGNAFAPGRDWSGILLNDRILLDCGPTVLPNLRAVDVDPGSIRGVFLSHLHADHTFGLPFMFLDSYFLTDRSEPLTIVGPAGSRKFLNKLDKMAYPDIDGERKKRLPLNFIELDDQTTFGFGKVQAEAIPMAHGDQAAFGYRVKIGKKTIAYSGDTGMCRGLKDLVWDADAVILEMSSPKFISKNHLCRQDIETIAGWCFEGTKIILTHLSEVPSDMKGYVFARDLKTLWV